MDAINAIKITMERGNKQNGMKKAVAYCDTGAFNEGFCNLAADTPIPPGSCLLGRSICCIVCNKIFDCKYLCPRIDREA